MNQIRYYLDRLSAISELQSMTDAGTAESQALRGAFVDVYLAAKMETDRIEAEWSMIEDGMVPDPE